MTRAELIRKLLETNHLNVAERRQLAPPTIDFSEIVAVIRDALERERRFSSETGTLEELQAGKYRLTCRPPSPERSAIASVPGGQYVDPETGKSYPSLDAAMRAGLPSAAPLTEDYPDLDSALLAFAGHIMNGDPLGVGLPGTIDGITISGLPAGEKPALTLWERIRSPFKPRSPAPVPASAPAVATPSKELTASIVRARGGSKSDAAILIAMLHTHDLLLPLAKPVAHPSVPPTGGRFESTGREPIAVHIIAGPRDEKFCPLFSEEEILAPVAIRYQWTTNGGPPQLLQIRGTAALEFALGLVETGRIHGAVMNPFHASAMPLNVDEIKVLLSGDPK